MVGRVEWIRAITFGKILDIGCHDGHVFPPGTADNVTGLDIDEWKVPHYGGGFKQGDAAALPFPDQSFDCAVLAEILEHVEDPVLVLREAARVAKVVYFTVPNEFNWAKENLPFVSAEEVACTQGLTVKQLGDKNTIHNDGCQNIVSNEEHPHLYHLRYFDSEVLANALEDAALIYRFSLLEYDGWSFFVGSARPSPRYVKPTANDTPKSNNPPKSLPGGELYDLPEYWNGELGYRPGTDGKGYDDFQINRLKEIAVKQMKPTGPVLDVGCAAGYIVQGLRKLGYDAYGIDISAYAINNLAPSSIRKYLTHGSAKDMKMFKDGEFDIAVSFSMLEHLPEQDAIAAAKEIARVAGRGIIAVCTSDSNHPEDDTSHLTFRPLEWWRNLFPPQFVVQIDTNEGWYNWIHDNPEPGVSVTWTPATVK